MASAPAQAGAGSPPSDAVSRGSKIGIGIAVRLGAILLAFLALQTCKITKAFKKLQAQDMENNLASTVDKEPTPKNPVQGIVAELDGVRNFELSNADREAHELGGFARYELTNRVS